MARLLVLMGSGETTPTMTTTHREVMARVGGPAVLLDTPYRFQENAPQITSKALQYFERSCGIRLEVAPWPEPAALSLARRAGFLFSGPGSPTYALRQWKDTPLQEVLAERLQRDGALVFASAAACTLGSLVVPVYEIYKCGADPYWLPGLDLLNRLGLPAVVVPHWNIAVGEDHDTRYCMLGQRRLEIMERMLPADQFLLGLDEHTALVLDLDTMTGQVSGKGTVVIRRHGHTTTFASGQPFSLQAGSSAPSEAPAAPARREAPLQAEAERLEEVFQAALAAHDTDQAVKTALELEELLVQWAQDTDAASQQRARAVLRSMLVQLGRLAVPPRRWVAPLVETLLTLRRQARDRREWEQADRIRQDLGQAGIEVRDTPEGTHWELVGDRSGCIQEPISAMKEGFRWQNSVQAIE